MKDGRRLEIKLGHPPGHAERPFEPDMLWAKFEDCVGDAMPAARARELFDRLQSLERLRSVADLPLVDVDSRQTAAS